MCEHWDCPYNGCKYHEFFDKEEYEKYKENNLLNNFLPDNGKEMDDCTLYLDL